MITEDSYLGEGLKLLSNSPILSLLDKKKCTDIFQIDYVIRLRESSISRKIVYEESIFEMSFFTMCKELELIFINFRNNNKV